jgi:hypothetical protein
MLLAFMSLVDADQASSFTKRRRGEEKNSRRGNAA